MAVLRWSLVSASTLYTDSHQKWPRSIGGGGDKSDDLMELLRNLPHVSKIALFSNKLAQVAPQMVFVYHHLASQ